MATQVLKHLLNVAAIQLGRYRLLNAGKYLPYVCSRTVRAYDPKVGSYPTISVLFNYWSYGHYIIN